MTKPMIEHYMSVKARYPSRTVVLVRVGGYYNAYAQSGDPGIVDLARILQVPLHSMGDGLALVFPAESVDTMLARLVRNGRSAVICERVVDPVDGHLIGLRAGREIGPGQFKTNNTIKENLNEGCHE